MRAILRVLPVFAFLATLPAAAQYSAAKIVFQNQAPYADAELLAVTGLAPGQKLEHDSLGTAAQHLMDTGLFDDVQASLAPGSGYSRNVVFALKPTPAEKLLPASFDNIVWFTPEELQSALHQQVPLYHGAASDAGNFADAIQAGLQQILVTKGINASLSHTIVEPTSDHPVRVVSFRIDKPAVYVASVELTNIASLNAKGLDTYLAKLSGHIYNEGLSGVSMEDLLLSPWRRNGYIAASLVSPQRTVATSPRGYEVSYTAQLNPGAPYKVSKIDWQPTPLFSAADFSRDAKLHPGDIAAANALAATETPILTTYHAQGYIDAFVLSSPTLDDTAHTVAYTLRVIPGEPYRLGTLTAVGLTGEARTTFDTRFTMKVGDLYSEPYVLSFIKSNLAQPAFAAYVGSYKAVGDPQTHLVDLTFTFTPIKPH